MNQSSRWDRLHQRLRPILVLLTCFLISSSARAANGSNQVEVYPVTEGMPLNSDFSVKVRTPGGTWQDLTVYMVKVAQGVDTQVPHSTSRVSMDPQNSSMAAFGFSGTIEVSITCNKGAVETARVRPISYGITPTVRGKTITFSLSQPRNVSIEVDGDIFHNVQLFANPIEETRPDPSDPNVIYYGPGLHQVGRMSVASGKSVYLAAGALVEGSLIVSRAENVRIYGRGILYQPTGQPSMRPKPVPGTSPAIARSSRRDAVLIEFSKNVMVDGITVVPTSYTVLVGQSQHVQIHNLKSFSAGGNNDGIDVFSSSDVAIRGVFMRNSDDTIAIYGHRWDYYGDTKGVTVEDSTLWADVAHPILVGTHGDSIHPETLEDLKFQNIDILEQREPQLDYQGCMSLNAGDSNLILHVVFDHVRVEDFREGQLVNLRVFFNKKYNTSAGRGIQDVFFKDVSYNGTHANPSMIMGYDPSHQIQKVVFEGLKINGRVIADDMPGKPAYFKTGDMADIFVGEHVEDVAFHTTVSAEPESLGR